MERTGDAVEFGPWNPGINSSIPAHILPLSTMFDERHVETSHQKAHELSDFCGLTPFELSVFRPERLIVHNLLIRVTTSLSVPDGPNYEELGINLRSMVHRIYCDYVLPELDRFHTLHEEIRADAKTLIAADLKLLRSEASAANIDTPNNFLSSIFNKISKPKPKQILSIEQRLAEFESSIEPDGESLDLSCKRALLKVVNSIIGHRGRLLGDNETIVDIATGMVLNDLGSIYFGEAIDHIFKDAAEREGYKILPPQEKPFILNVKGASASGKSTIRPKQRELVENMGLEWSDFALISPDYWRKYLLDYQSLGEHFKYGAMLTGHELEIIDKKLDRHVARRSKSEKIPHLLIDRFRFDSFNVGGDQSSQLLTRFGDTVFMFFMITPPQSTIERAYERGLTTGRYKAVDDLIDHNVEAYSGMPKLFLFWSSTKKRVHYEFLDNSVEKGELPRTVAFGWNLDLTILDIPSMMNVDRFRKLNVEASCPVELFEEDEMTSSDTIDFLLQCAKVMHTIRFVDPDTGQLYAIIRGGEAVWWDVDYVDSARENEDLSFGLSAFSWPDMPDRAAKPSEAEMIIHQGDCSTLGAWKSKSAL